MSILLAIVLGMVLVFLTDIFFFNYNVKDACIASAWYGVIFLICVCLVKIVLKV